MDINHHLLSVKEDETFNHQYITCPYDKKHKMIRSRLIFHLPRCQGKAEKAHLFKNCKYNFLHIYPNELLEMHEIQCPDKDFLKHFQVLADYSSDQYELICPPENEQNKDQMHQVQVGHNQAALNDHDIKNDQTKDSILPETKSINGQQQYGAIIEDLKQSIAQIQHKKKKLGETKMIDKEQIDYLGSDTDDQVSQDSLQEFQINLIQGDFSNSSDTEIQLQLPSQDKQIEQTMES